VTWRIFKNVIQMVLGIAIVASGLLTAETGASATSPQSFTVTFVANVPGSTFASPTETNSGTATLTPFSTMGFTYSNYFFTGWNTSSDGSGTPYADQASFVFSSDTRLYAQWTQIFHSVLFYRNSSASDNLQSQQLENKPTTLTSITALGFSKSNYYFAGWNTLADGSGVTYLDQSTYTFTSDIKLFAQWAPNKETLYFGSNSANGSIATRVVDFGTTFTLPSGNIFNRPNFRFVGWNTASDGGGKGYSQGSTIMVTGSQTYYAQWVRLSYRVTFANPGVKGKIAPLDDLAGVPVRLRSGSVLSRPGYSFAGWYTDSRGGVFAGASGDSYTPSRSLTLFAHWSPHRLTRLDFALNGGEGYLPAMSVHEGQSVVIPEGLGLHRSGFTFRGWASNPRAKVPSVHIGDRIVLTHRVVLYALWRRNLPPSTPQVLLGSVGTFAANSSALSPAMRRSVMLFALNINENNRTAIVLYGYASSADRAAGGTLLSLQRAEAVKKQLGLDLNRLNDVGVSIRAAGEGRLSNPVLSTFRNVEVFAN